MLSDFDQSVLDNPEFQEDAVREEIIAPVLKWLGYKPCGNAKVIRGRKLAHPFVNIGSKTHKVNIIPDYVLELEGVPRVIIDAKSPQTSLENTKHVEQAYSYAIHPEIRASMYSLCNGKEWIVWDVDRFEPAIKITISELIAKPDTIGKFLQPSNVQFPEKRNFLPDFGLRMLKLGISDTTIQYFVPVEIGNIMRVEDNLYTIIGDVDFGEEHLAVSFDMNREMYKKALSLFTEDLQKHISYSLSRQPYSAHGFPAIEVVIAGRFGELQIGKYEDFVPIVVSEVKKFG